MKELFYYHDKLGQVAQLSDVAEDEEGRRWLITFVKDYGQYMLAYAHSNGFQTTYAHMDLLKHMIIIPDEVGE